MTDRPYWHPHFGRRVSARSRIPRRQQFLLLLHDVQRIGIDEIARRMRMPVGVVRRQIAQARRLRAPLRMR